MINSKILELKLIPINSHNFNEREVIYFSEKSNQLYLVKDLPEKFKDGMKLMELLILSEFPIQHKDLYLDDCNEIRSSVMEYIEEYWDRRPDYRRIEGAINIENVHKIPMWFIEKFIKAYNEGIPFTHVKMNFLIRSNSGLSWKQYVYLKDVGEQNFIITKIEANKNQDVYVLGKEEKFHKYELEYLPVENKDQNRYLPRNLEGIVQEKTFTKNKVLEIIDSYFNLYEEGNRETITKFIENNYYN